METIVAAPTVLPTTGGEPPTAPVDPVQSSESPVDWNGEFALRFAKAMGENTDWAREREAQLLEEHPDWWLKTVVVATVTPSKILAVHEDRGIAINLALQSAELMEAAKREGMQPGDLATAILLGDELD